MKPKHFLLLIFTITLGAGFIFGRLDSESKSGKDEFPKPNNLFEINEGEQLDYSGHQLIRVLLRSQSDAAKINRFTQTMPDSLVDVWKEGFTTDLFIHPSARDQTENFLTENQLKWDVLVVDFYDLIAEERLSMRAKNRLLLKEVHGIKSTADFDLGVYHSYDEIQWFLGNLSFNFPNVVQLGSLGKSYEGRDLRYVKIGAPSPADADESTRPAMWLDAGIHAREWIAPAVALNFIKMLVTDPKYSQILQNAYVYVLPSLNPDGYEYSRRRDRMWRRTRSWNAGAKCFGVDANRNFPYHYNESGTTGYCSQIYSGPGPLSEPETRQLTKFMLDNKNTLKGYVTLHAYGNLLMYPYAHRVGTYPPDVDDLITMANDIAEVIKKNDGPMFEIGTGADILYEAAGTSESTAKNIGIKYTYTMELTSGRQGGFVYPEYLVADYAKQVCPGLLYLAKRIAEMNPTKNF